ncbi:MAG: YbgC/FadM family acyl-CoA thioesterase [Hyphomicrobiales bacterium]|jgi:acyl-CoA thioester hydrolase
MPITPAPSPTNTITVRVYYEDTDLAGIVYHANYLKFMERARTETLRAHGIDQTRLAEEDVFLSVTAMDIAFKSPARIDDLLTVEAIPISTTGVRGTIAQRVLLEDRELCTAMVTVVCMNGKGRPVRMPPTTRALFRAS